MQGNWPSIKEFKGRFKKISKPCEKNDDQVPIPAGQKEVKLWKRPKIKCSIPLLQKGGKRKEYKCLLCDSTSPTSRGLRYHVQGHFRKPPFRCKYCRLSLPSAEELEGHANLRHRHGRVCELCGSRFRRSSEVKEHLGAAHGIKVTTSRDGGKGGGGPLFCCLCREDFYTPRGLDDHVFKAHPGVGPYGCRLCPLKFESEENYTGHFLFAHTTWPTETLLKLEC